MSLLKDLIAPAKRAPICKIMQIQETLEPADQKVFLAAVENIEDWPAETLARELKRRGVDVGRERIRIHRRGDCVCVKQ